MKLRHFYLLVCLAISSAVVQTIFAQDKPKDSSQLVVGDDAPGLKIEEWVKGGGFVPLEKGKVYLIDLWATWCVPCIAGMPHLSELQAKYKAKGLEVIGITNEDKYGNTFDNVKKFVQRKDSAMNYNVAWLPVSKKDDDQGIWLHPWMLKSGSANLPTAFLMDKKGKVVYIGDPFTIDSTLNDVMNDRYDINVLKKEYSSGIDAEKALVQFIATIKAKDINTAIQNGKHLLSDFTYVKPNTYLVMGWQVSHMQGEINPELLQIGYEAAVRGVKLTKFNSPGFFDVLAAVHAARKDYLSAVITEKVAISLSEGDMKKNQTKNMESYLAEYLKKEK